MNDRVKTIFEQAQKLPSTERAELAGLLLETIDVDPAIQQAWVDEVNDRIIAHEARELATKSAADVLAKHLKA